MKKTILQIILAGCMALTSHAADTIVLKNGDTLTGKILSEEGDTVVFESGMFGKIDLAKENVKEIKREPIPEPAPEPEKTAESEKPAEPETAPQTVPNTEPEKQPEPQAKTRSFFNIMKVSDARALAVQQRKDAEEKRTDQSKNHFLERKRWSGKTQLAIAMRESNSEQRVTGNETTQFVEKYETYHFSGNVDWKGDKNKLRWDMTYRYSRNELRKKDDFFNVQQQYNRDIQENYFATAKTVYQQDFRRRIDQEFLQTAEMGVKWSTRPKLQLTTSVGGGYHKYDRIARGDEQISVSEPKFIFDESLNWNIVDSLTLIQKYTHLGDLTNYHFTFSAGLENKLIHDIFLRVEYRLDRDTEVFYDDKGYYDKALLTTLVYKF